MENHLNLRAMKYFISAGEPSGDLHASELIAAIMHNRQICGDSIWRRPHGGRSRCEPVIHYREMAYEIQARCCHLPQIASNMKARAQSHRRLRPDVCSSFVDYPSFNPQTAAYACKHGTWVAYYISLKVWAAWKEWRVKEIRRLVDTGCAAYPI